MRAEELEPVDVRARVPGEHNRRNAAAALAALELAGVARAEAERVLVEFRGAGRRLELRGEAGGVAVLDSYAHHPAELAADTRRRARRRTAACSSSSSRTSTRGRSHLAHGFADALAARRRGVRDRDLSGARGAAAGVTGKLSSTSSRGAVPACRSAGRRRSRTAPRLVAAWARPGDTVLTLGAGDVDRAAPLILEALA